MKKLGIYVDTIEYSQLFLCLNHQLHLSKNDLNVTVFFNNSGKFINNCEYTVMPAYNIWKANFPIIATDCISARYLIDAHPIKDKYFYIWSLDWLTHGVKDFRLNLSTYCNNTIKLLVRNELMFNIVKSIWKEPVGIIDDFEYRSLYEIAK